MKALHAADKFDARVTSVEFPWPPGLTGLERIMLSASGDLQRLLSAFFMRPITIALQSASTSPSPRTQPASPSSPLTQKRRVHLLCASRIACIATSTVTITSQECERLFLDEGYAIGQLFRKMKTVPRFCLLDVGVYDDGAGAGENINAEERKTVKLWRRYTLDLEGFACEILEEFPDRDMFVLGERWLEDYEPLSDRDNTNYEQLIPSSSTTAKYSGSSSESTSMLAQILVLSFAIVFFAVLSQYDGYTGLKTRAYILINSWDK